MRLLPKLSALDTGRVCALSAAVLTTTLAGGCAAVMLVNGWLLNPLGVIIDAVIIGVNGYTAGMAMKTLRSLDRLKVYAIMKKRACADCKFYRGEEASRECAKFPKWHLASNALEMDCHGEQWVPRKKWWGKIMSDPSFHYSPNRNQQGSNSHGLPGQANQTPSSGAPGAGNNTAGSGSGQTIKNPSTPAQAVANLLGLGNAAANQGNQGHGSQVAVNQVPGGVTVTVSASGPSAPVFIPHAPPSPQALHTLYMQGRQQQSTPHFGRQAIKPPYPEVEAWKPAPFAGTKFGEIRAYRCWAIAPDGLHLRSISAQNTWYPHKPMEATAGWSRTDQGVHAFKRPQDVMNFITMEMGGNMIAVYGEVLLWGEVHEFDIGFQAEFAVIDKIGGIYGGAASAEERQTLLDGIRAMYEVGDKKEPPQP